MADSITLTRDGISATVHVGDAVPMMDGTERIIQSIDGKHGLYLQAFAEVHLYNENGERLAKMGSPLINIAALRMVLAVRL